MPDTYLAAENLGILRASLQRSLRMWNTLAANGKTVSLPPSHVAQVANQFRSLLGIFDAAATAMDLTMVPLPPEEPAYPTETARPASRPRLITHNGEPV